MDIEKTFERIKELAGADGLTVEQQIEGIELVNGLMELISDQPLIIEEPEVPADENAPDPADKAILDHTEYDGMSEATALELAQNGAKRDGDLVALGEAGIDALPIKGIGKAKAKKWYERARELIS